MPDVRARYVPPAINQTAFNCPHCNALAQQFWFDVRAVQLKSDETPLRMTAEEAARHKFDDVEDAEDRRSLEEFVERLATGHLFLDEAEWIYSRRVHNASLSQCYNCGKLALWTNDLLLWPQRGEAPVPNPDLPADVRADYDEASSILDLSPRGAAALLRLAIEKLCAQLGEEGRTLDQNIALLVQRGVPEPVHKALDVLRVIGNNAVHPGQIDLKDDRATAESLFRLVNLIAESQLTEKKHVEELYSKLPPEAIAAIERRNNKSRNK